MDGSRRDTTVANKGLLCILPSAGMILLITCYSTAQPLGRGMKPVTEKRGRACAQQSDAAQANERRTYLNLELKINKDGSVEVTRAAELPGSVRLNSAPTSDYIYEVSSGQQTLAVAFLRDDPFTVRGFADPSFPQGEKIDRQETATVIINVPAFSLSMLEKCKLTLRLYRLRPGVNVDRMDADAFPRLREAGDLTPVLSVPAPKLTEAIKKAAKARG